MRYVLTFVLYFMYLYGGRHYAGNFFLLLFDPGFKRGSYIFRGGYQLIILIDRNIIN